MQQFTIPQFIDVEDKIIGPITARQFIIILAGFVLGGVIYKFFDFSFFIFSAAIILGFIVLFSFVKVNGRPFHFFLINMIQTLKRPKLRIWNKVLTGAIEFREEKKVIPVKEEKAPVKKLDQSRLNELSLIVDTQGAYKGERSGKAVISDLQENKKIFF